MYDETSDIEIDGLNDGCQRNPYGLLLQDRVMHFHSTFPLRINSVSKLYLAIFFIFFFFFFFIFYFFFFFFLAQILISYQISHEYCKL